MKVFWESNWGTKKTKIHVEINGKTEDICKEYLIDLNGKQANSITKVQKYKSTNAIIVNTTSHIFPKQQLKPSPRNPKR